MAVQGAEQFLIASKDQVVSAGRPEACAALPKGDLYYLLAALKFSGGGIPQYGIALSQVLCLTWPLSCMARRYRN